MSVQLRLLDKADKEILKLPRAVNGAIYDFQHKFRDNPDANRAAVQTARREIPAVLGPGHDGLPGAAPAGRRRDYLLVAVKHRKEVYDDLSRFAYRINPVTGGIEFVDLAPVGARTVGRGRPAGPGARRPAGCRCRRVHRCRAAGAWASPSRCCR